MAAASLHLAQVGLSECQQGEIRSSLRVAVITPCGLNGFNTSNDYSSKHCSRILPPGSHGVGHVLREMGAVKP